MTLIIFYIKLYVENSECYQNVQPLLLNTTPLYQMMEVITLSINQKRKKIHKKNRFKIKKNNYLFAVNVMN